MKKLSILIVAMFVCGSAFAHYGKHHGKHHAMQHAKKNCKEQGLKTGTKEFKDCMGEHHEKAKEWKAAHNPKHQEDEQTDK